MSNNSANALMLDLTIHSYMNYQFIKSMKFMHLCVDVVYYALIIFIAILSLLHGSTIDVAIVPMDTDVMMTTTT